MGSFQIRATEPGSIPMIWGLDESFADTPLVDPVEGIPDFSSTRVRVEKV